MHAMPIQVIAILEAGQPLPFSVKAANLDLPELQGEPEDIAKEKCRLAAQQVPAFSLVMQRSCACAVIAAQLVLYGCGGDALFVGRRWGER